MSSTRAGPTLMPAPAALIIPSSRSRFRSRQCRARGCSWHRARMAANAPLLQAWFARTQVGRSPYRLYALSNAGSLLALLSYPFVLEPLLTRQTQAMLWTWGTDQVSSAVRTVKSSRSMRSASPNPADRPKRSAAARSTCWRCPTAPSAGLSASARCRTRRCSTATATGYGVLTVAAPDLQRYRITPLVTDVIGGVIDFFACFFQWALVRIAGLQGDQTGHHQHHHVKFA